MIYKVSNKEFNFLNKELGLSSTSIHLGIKLSNKNQISLH